MMYNEQGEFQIYNGEVIPFDDNSFDLIILINTIYFWKNPQKLMKDIERSLKENGICILTYAEKDFMSNLPFVRKKFKLYNKSDIQKIVKSTKMDIVESIDNVEIVKSKTEKQVKRSYSMVKLIRKNK